MIEEDRYDRERRFHDDRFAEDVRGANRFYDIDAASIAHLTADIDRLSPGSRVLDFGCGANAEAGIHAAQAGMQVVAFDLSPVAIEQARRLAGEKGVEDRIEFHVLNAEAVDLPDAGFDAVYGTGVLHHLDLRLGYAEVARLLKPEGHAMFVEPMGHNALVNLYRRLTPDQRTPDEHPLRTADFELARHYFADVEPTYFTLLSLALLPAGRLRRSRRLLERLDSADRALLDRLPGVGRYAWLVALRLAGPRKT